MKLTKQQKRENAERADRGEEVLAFYRSKYGDMVDDVSNLTDILADLMHYALTKANDEDAPLNFDDAVQTAAGHLAAEINGED